MNAFQLVASTINIKSNVFGALASGLCLIHCLATPLFFMAQAASHHDHDHHHHGAGWWSGLDYVFLAVSAIAVFYSARNSSLKWMPSALAASWVVLAFLIINEKLHLMHLPHEAIYIPTLSLIGLHLYNIRYCNCEEEERLVAEQKV
ncbi:MAG: MerC domain-containing protein [Bacteroidota bacterium]